MNGNGLVGRTQLTNKDLDPEFKGRFIRVKADSKLDILIDTKTGVQYMILKPTDFDNGNSTVTVTPLLDGSGFPLVDERFLEN